MPFCAGRCLPWVAILVLGAVILAIVSTPLPTAADQRVRDNSGAADFVVAEAEQATLSGPAALGNGSGVGYVQFGSGAVPNVFQPSAPYYATFYYPWYGAPATDGHWRYWDGQDSQPPNTWFSHYLPDPLPGAYDPSRELYSSHDPNILLWQFGKLAEAKIEVAISSWWGQGERSDDNFRFMLKDVMKRSENPYPNLRLALYYEAESKSDPTVTQIVNDLDYIGDQYAGEPAYLKVDGKPVIFVYARGADGVGMAQRWAAAKAQAKLPFYVVLKVFSGYRTINPQPDSWHQYGPATRASDQSPYSFSVSPGFWFDSAGEAPRLSRNVAEFQNAASQMVAADAAWKLVTTWNEWGEGTAVEPGEQVVFDSSTGRDELDPAGAPFKNTYVDVLRELLPALEAGTGRKVERKPDSISATSVVTAAESFSFAAGGDLGGGSAATASLEALANSATDFFLGIGDMSYDEIIPESAWCSYVQQHVGATYPFEVLVGNHEEQPSGPDGFIDNFAACLPDRLDVTGLYAHRYYFDYPPGAPLARFILIDADLYRGASKAEYCSGETENCDWLKARIDEAKAQGLWTIVGMHKNCLTIGVKPCEIGTELLNVLIERKVDLVLHGHDHGYQRSKQLRLGVDCPAVAALAYNPGCVADDGSDANYVRDAGLVFVISAAFGRSPYAVNLGDPEVDYLATWMGSGEASNGFVQFTVTQDTIDGLFINSIGSFTDHLTITKSTVPPTPIPSVTPGATLTPTVTPPITPTPCVTPPVDQGVAALNVDFPVAGSYYVWNRLMAANAGHRGYWVQVDEACPRRVAGSQPGRWEWVSYENGDTASPIREQISAGEHTVTLYGVDPGVKVDKVLFTLDPDPVLPTLPPFGEGERVFLPLVTS